MITPPNPTDLLLNFYRSRPGLPKKPRMAIPPNMTVTNLGHGLGDTMMLTDVASVGRNVYSGSPHFKEVMAMSSGGYRQQITTPQLLDAPTAIVAYESGNGHFLQRLKRVLGIQFVDDPKGHLYMERIVPVHNRVVMHFEPGYHAKWQSENIRPNARSLSHRSLGIICQFRDNHPELDFKVIGHSFIADLPHEQPGSTTDLIRAVSQASLFIGINSGPMHVATALGIPCIVIVNFPDAAEIMLPCLKPLGLPDEQWLYPQHCHLHQDNAGPLVPQLSVESLEAAMNGEVYPYRKTDWLPLIHERL